MVRRGRRLQEDGMNQVEKLKQISAQEFASLGMHGLAYVKRVVINEAVAYAVYAADGTEVALLPDREIAFATVRQHELEPLSVH
jgi:hypothetical protein